MAIQIITFGKIKEITGSSLSLENVMDTDSLVKELSLLYPGLADAKYLIAVDKNIVHGNTALTEHSTVALLPPFSGG